MRGCVIGARRQIAPNCRPDQILVIAGRALMVPWLEQRRWMDGRTRPVPIRVEKAYAMGGTPIDVEAIATVKISTDRDCVGNAIERFLGHDPNAVQQVAARTLEGHLRLMVAGLTPEQVNQDRLRFADRVLEVTRPDMTKPGLQVDTFKILRVSDGVDDLDSLGRARLAELERQRLAADVVLPARAREQAEEWRRRGAAAATLANLTGLHPAVMRTFLEQVRDTLGIDVLQALNPHRTPSHGPPSSPFCCSSTAAVSPCAGVCAAC